MVAFLHTGHAGSDIDDDTGAFVAQDGREQPLRVGARQREFVGVTDASGLHLDQDLSGFRPIEVDLRDLEGLGLLQRNGGTGFHGNVPPRRCGRHRAKRRTRRPKSPLESLFVAARSSKRCNDGQGNGLITDYRSPVPTNGGRWGLAPEPNHLKK